MKLSIVEANGWSKTISLEKAISRVGSSPANEVRLASENIAPVHLQILNAPGLPSGCRLVNFGGSVTVYNRGAVKTMEPFAILDMYENDVVEIGEYRLTFHLPLSAGLLRNSNSIEASLSFTNAVLSPGNSLEGRLTIKNIGGSNNCQCRVMVKGLDAACYQVDPIPLLYSGAQEDVRVLLFHQLVSPNAGAQDIQFIISAPESYPGEEVVLRQGIYVVPVYQQQILILDDFHTETAVQGSHAPAAEAGTLASITTGTASSPAAAPEIQPSPAIPMTVHEPAAQGSTAQTPAASGQPAALIASVPASDVPAIANRAAPRVRAVPQRRQTRVVKETDWVESGEINFPAQRNSETIALPTQPEAQMAVDEPASAQRATEQPVEEGQPDWEAGRDETADMAPAAGVEPAEVLNIVSPEPVQPPASQLTPPVSARTPPVSNPAKVKVVRDQQDDFWDEG